MLSTLFRKRQNYSSRIFFVVFLFYRRSLAWTHALFDRIGPPYYAKNILMCNMTHNSCSLIIFNEKKIETLNRISVNEWNGNWKKNKLELTKATHTRGERDRATTNTEKWESIVSFTFHRSINSFILFFTWLRFLFSILHYSSSLLLFSFEPRMNERISVMKEIAFLWEIKTLSKC